MGGHGNRNLAWVTAEVAADAEGENPKRTEMAYETSQSDWPLVAQSELALIDAEYPPDYGHSIVNHGGAGPAPSRQYAGATGSETRERSQTTTSPRPQSDCRVW